MDGKQGRRIARVCVSARFLMEMMTRGWRIPSVAGECVRLAENGLPEDASLVGIEDVGVGMLALVVESEEFAELEEGEAIPFLQEPLYVRYDTKDERNAR